MHGVMDENPLLNDLRELARAEPRQAAAGVEEKLVQAFRARHRRSYRGCGVVSSGGLLAGARIGAAARTQRERNDGRVCGAAIRAERRAV